MNQESKEISTNKLNFKQIIPDYRLVFPCPHCGQEINDSHFSQEKKAFNYLNEQAKELIEKHFLAQESQYQKKWLENLEISRAYENIAPVKSLRETLQRKEVEIAHLQSSEYIEKLERVKNLVSENQELRKEKDILSRQSRSVKRKGELFEQFVVEELHRVFDGQDKISKLTQLGEKADFLQEVLTSSEPRKVAGRIVYEVKDAENWDNKWVSKLENDMARSEADFGIIVATCENGKSVRCLDPRKKIYVSDENNFAYIAKIMRDILIQKHNLLERTRSDQQKRLENFDRWIKGSLPQHFLRLEGELSELSKNANSIDRAVEGIKKTEINLQRIILEEIKGELNNF